jgi:hypothetical protein
MKAIIRGRRYNTAAPQTVAVAHRREGSSSDFRYFDESLYRTGQGSWFLAGEGGPLSSYGRGTGNGNERTGGERIIPLTPEEAQEWLEQAGETEALEQYFADAIKDA